VPSVAPALEAHDDVGAIGEHVDDLAFAFVTPLGANNRYDGHNRRV
jgi:hypothetical protein